LVEDREHWDRFLVEERALGQVFGRRKSIGTGFWSKKEHWDRFLVEERALGQVFGRRKSTGTGFSPRTSGFICQFISAVPYTHLYLHHASMTNGPNRGTLKKPMLFRKLGIAGWKITVTLKAGEMEIHFF
jgi:hypothetical protein